MTVSKVGSVTRGAPELRFSAKGVPVAKFGIAVKPYVPKDQPQPETVFYDVTCFNSLAEHVAECLTKGDRVLVIGEPKVEEWDDKRTGEKRSKKVIIADAVGPDLRFCGADVHRQARTERPKAAAQTPAYEEGEEPF